MAATSRKKEDGRETMRAVPPAEPGLIQERVARRAYELFERRGYRHGRDMEDWLEAEGQIREEENRRAASRRLEDYEAGPGVLRSGVAGPRPARPLSGRKPLSRT